MPLPDSRRSLSQAHRKFSPKPKQAARAKKSGAGRGTCSPVFLFSHYMGSGLTNRVVLVTGAFGGIGQQVARVFVQEGARCILHFGKHGERARSLARALDADCIVIGADLTSELDVKQLFAEAEAKAGPV